MSTRRRTRLVSLFLGVPLSLGLASTAHAAAFVRGPYLQDLGSRQVAVLIELDAMHAVSIEIEGGAASDPGALRRTIAAAGTDVVHEMVIGGLEPAKTYRYTVIVDDGTRSASTFTTAPEDDRPFRFLLYGDNRTDDAAHAGVVARMVGTPGDFLVQTGDMVSDGRDEAGWRGFFAIERELLRSRCLFPTLGNHEIAVPTSDGAQRYARAFRVPAPEGAGERYYTFRWGMARFFMLDAQDDFTSQERVWLESALQQADGEPGVSLRFVVLHNGPYSSGLHGPNVSLHFARVPELLRRHRIDVVFSGHDHIYERGEVSGQKYVVSGGGGAPLYGEHRDEPTALRFEAVHHFLAVDVSHSGGTVTAIRKDGSILEQCEFLGGATPGWGCPNADGTPGALPTTGASLDRPPVAPTSPRRACDRSYALSGTEWIGAALATALLLALGVRRKGRADENE